MRLTTLRRTSAIAGLALVPALAFGAAAQAAPAAAPAPSAGQTQAPQESPAPENGVVAERGTVSWIGNVQTPDGPITTFQFGPEGAWWSIDSDTVVVKDGQVVSPEALQVGDHVTAHGELTGQIVDAAKVEIG